MMRLQPMHRSEWPICDAQRWERALTPTNDLFGDADGAAAGLSACTKRNYQRAWSMLLAYLAAIGDLDAAGSIASRATPARLNSWVEAMRAMQRSNGTIRQYLACVHAMVRLLEPRADVAYMLRPGGISLNDAFPVEAKQTLVLDTEDLMARARDAHQLGMTAATVFARRTRLRDAALMSLLARRGPRILSVAAMRLGSHIDVQADGMVLVTFPRADIKTRKQLGWALDAECSGYMRDYLRFGRPLFPGAAATDALWLAGGHRGDPW